MSGEQVTNLKFCLKIALLSKQDYEFRLCRLAGWPRWRKQLQQPLDAGRRSRLYCSHHFPERKRAIHFNDLLWIKQGCHTMDLVTRLHLYFKARLIGADNFGNRYYDCLLYTSPSPRDS